MSKNTKIVVLLVALAVVAGLIIYLFMPQVISLKWGQELSSSAETPYGEKLEINLNVGGQTSGSASWLASYEDTESQNVYEVNSTYKSQEQVTLEYSLSVTYASVGSITNVKTSITAIDTSDQSEHEYVLANNKGLSGSSPISDDGSTQKSIATHLSDITGSATDCTVDYKVYCKVQATGTISGATLTAEIPLTKFHQLHYERTTESTEADVTPTVSVAGWVEMLQTPEMLTIIGLIVLAVVLAVIPTKPKEKTKKGK